MKGVMVENCKRVDFVSAMAKIKKCSMQDEGDA